MKARDIMTRDVVSANLETTTQEIARLLVERGISAVPVVDASGAVVGMISEGDLIGRDEVGRASRRDWWLELLAEGTELSPAFLAALRTPLQTARDIMAGPVVTVGEDTDVKEIAQLLTEYRIKRVPVVCDGRVTGIVSRADLVRALAHEPRAASSNARHGVIGEALTRLDERLHHGDATNPARSAAVWSPHEDLAPLADQFRGLMSDFAHEAAQARAEATRREAEQNRQRVIEMIDHHISDNVWRSFLHQARQAAEHGEKEFMLLRFPSQLCDDGGRAINVRESSWPATLRGEAAEVYLRWERELRPHGFHLGARVLEFPGGKPGDIGLFLDWA